MSTKLTIGLQIKIKARGKVKVQLLARVVTASVWAITLPQQKGEQEEIPTDL